MKVNPESLFEKYPQSVLFQKISDICSAVNAVVNTKHLLEISLEKTMDLFDARRGSIFILNKSGKNLVLKIARGINPQEAKKMVKRPGKGIVGLVAQKKEPIAVEDIAKDKRFKDYKPRRGYQTPSFLCAPLMIKDELVGVLNLADKGSGMRFRKDEIQLIDFLSSQIALNYRRVDLYKKVRKVTKEKENLKSRLGRSDKEAENLKKQIYIHEKLATIGKLAGGIAHEFNNPLDGVMRYTNLCLEHVKEDEVVEGYLLEIRQGLNRMVGIVKNLLDCSRSHIPNQARVSVQQAVDRSLTNIQCDISCKSIHVTRDVAPDLPLLNDLGLETVLTNLLRNAVEAMDEGGRISISAQQDKEFLKLVIKDNGPGIAGDRVDQIFEPFYTTKDMQKGCGLGLTIVGEIIKAYNGKIAVDSKLGRGATFIIQLPIKDHA